RIVIARAILKNAPIIVLDEATAFADPENEQKIQRAFEELMKNKTVIIIAHRLSTVRGADKIVVIDKGRLVEEGTHDTLVKAGGRYSRMWEQYTGAMNWGIGGGVTGAEQSALTQPTTGETFRNDLVGAMGYSTREPRPAGPGKPPEASLACRTGH
ncbi:MAG: hypothetical protein LBB83_12105, partial [Treponema sp.]|nr:hypothetical protein [Treponema sp.]